MNLTDAKQGLPGHMKQPRVEALYLCYSVVPDTAAIPFNWTSNGLVASPT